MSNAYAPTPASEKSSVYFDANAASAEHLAHACVPNASTDTVMPNAHGNMHADRNGNGNGAALGGGRMDSGYVADAETTDAGAEFDPAAAHYRAAGSAPAGHNNNGASGGLFTAKAPGSVVADPAYNQNNQNNNQTERDARVAGSGTSGSEPVPSHSTGVFADGAGMTGPSSVPGRQEEYTPQQRSETAENNMSPTSMNKITKAEIKDAKQLSKIIKAEGKVEKSTLNSQVRELARVQKVQKQAAALSAFAKAAKVEHKLHTKFLAMKGKYEQVEADLRAKAEQRDMSREHAQKQTELLGTMTREVEELRRNKSVDDREREARLEELSNVGSVSRKGTVRR